MCEFLLFPILEESPICIRRFRTFFPKEKRPSFFKETKFFRGSFASKVTVSRFRRGILLGEIYETFPKDRKQKTDRRQIRYPFGKRESTCFILKKPNFILSYNS
ncbi:hypothetical protein DLM75_17115 [Leptospira stimsonii]|uniref:Uncharacterized protein n=1 Tax=Leptospira stimsonii TaxID=2202203 RepID=A0A396Z140_9LEPT|nr:hypothetical protein DLM75_17115 [Leptospira stimsonii]